MFGALLEIAGDYTQGDGILSVDIGDVLLGDGFDVLAVGGLVTLDGALEIYLIDGFLRAPGDEFWMMTYGSQTGRFSRLSGPNVGQGLALDVEHGATGITLTTVPEFATLSLLLPLGFALLAGRAKKHGR